MTDPTPTVNKKIAEQPTPAGSLDEAKQMLEGLPKPPPPYADDDQITVWLHNVAALGADRLNWVYRPEVFNKFFDSVKRGRQQHIVGHLLRAIDEENKRRREVEAQQRAAKQRDELADLLRGWRAE